MGFMMYNPEESRVYGLKKKKYGIIWVIFQIYPNIISGWWFQSRKKYESVGIIIPYIWKNKKCFKPPTRYGLTKNMLWGLLKKINPPGPPALIGGSLVSPI